MTNIFRKPLIAQLLGAVALVAIASGCVFDYPPGNCGENIRKVVVLVAAPDQEGLIEMDTTLETSRGRDNRSPILTVISADKATGRVVGKSTVRNVASASWPISTTVNIDTECENIVCAYLLWSDDGSSPAHHSYDEKPWKLATSANAAMTADIDTKHCYAANKSNIDGDTLQLALNSITAGLVVNSRLHASNDFSSVHTTTLYYLDPYPSTFDIDIWNAVSAYYGICTSAKSTAVDDSTITLITDRLFTFGEKGTISLRIEIADENGNIVGGINRLKVPFERNHTTKVTADFFNSMPTAGIYINPNFDGDINIRID